MFLRRKFPKAVRDSSERPYREFDDIVANLGYLFRGRRGASSMDDRFGLGDAGFRTPEETLLALGREVRENIERFETRLKVLELDEDHNAEGDPFLIAYCKVRESGQRLKITVNLREKSFDVGLDDSEENPDALV